MLDRTREIGQTKPALKCRRAVLYVLLILFVDLFFCEQYVRFQGFTPVIIDRSKLPSNTTYLLSPSFGYMHRPGLHDPSEDATTGEWVWPNFQRASRPLPVKKRHRYKVALNGCSWTYGLGANDDWTYAWQLNELYPNIVFDNYGECEYGAQFVQMRMRDTIRRGKKYDLFIYAYIYDHLNRDLRTHWQLCGPQDAIHFFPSYELNHPTKDYRLLSDIWWGESHFALVRFFHLSWVHLELNAVLNKPKRAAYTREQQYQAFRENVLAMRNLAESQGSDFALLGLGEHSRRMYDIALTDSGIDVEMALEGKPNPVYYNVTPDDPGDPSIRITHPNANGHAKIAEAVTALLKRRHLPAKIMTIRRHLSRFSH